MSSIAPKCFCLCAGDFIECSCPDLRGCSKCTAQYQATRCKKKRLSLSLSDVSNTLGTDRFHSPARKQKISRRDLSLELLSDLRNGPCDIIGDVYINFVLGDTVNITRVKGHINSLALGSWFI